MVLNTIHLMFIIITFENKENNILILLQKHQYYIYRFQQYNNIFILSIPK